MYKTQDRVSERCSGLLERKCPVLASQEHGVLVGRRQSTMCFSSFFPLHGAKSWAGLPSPGVPDFVTLKQEVSLGNGWLLPQSPNCQGGTVSSWPSPYHDIEPGSFFVPQNSSYHACHQLILPEGEPGTHCRAGNSRNFTLMGRRKRSGEGREGSPSGVHLRLDTCRKFPFL